MRRRTFTVEPRGRSPSAGLLGHLHHLAAAAKLAARVRTGAVPVFDFVRSLAEECCVPGGTRKNLRYVTPHTRFDPAISDTDRLILCDAQTSGGLLIAVPAAGEAKLLAELAREGTLAAALVGELFESAPGRTGEIEVTPGR